MQDTHMQDRFMAPLIVNSNAQVVPDEYIVFYKSSVNAEVSASLTAKFLESAKSFDDSTKVLFEYDNGFAARFTEQSVLDSIRAVEQVEFVEQNQVISLTLAEQSNPPSWGLARTWQKKFSVKNRYDYPESAGSDVDAYIIDTGINTQHVEFEGRATWGFAVDNVKTDGNGHGTHVSGTVAGKTYGIAKKANLIAVKVLNSGGSGTTAGVVKGIQFAANAAKNSGKKSVANMSLGGGRSSALDSAVANAVASGLHFAVAAGNSADDACYYSPADVSTAVTVAASTSSDTLAYFSNIGKCVDIIAPGLDITSAWIGSTTAKNTISGTSMASPHVCGVMALLLADADYTPAQMQKTLVDISTKNAVSNVPTGTPNALLFSLNGYKNDLYW